MPHLTDIERAAVAAQFHRDNDTPIACTKPQVIAVVNAVDEWWDANVAGMSAAINGAGGSGLTADQKLHIFVWVVRRRWNGS